MLPGFCIWMLQFSNLFMFPSYFGWQGKNEVNKLWEMRQYDIVIRELFASETVYESR